MKQLMSYQIELSDERDLQIGRFTVGLLLLVPEERIATDIVTGGSNIISSDRNAIKSIIEDNYHPQKSNHPLKEIDSYLTDIKAKLSDYLAEKSIELKSMTVDLFVDLL